MKQNEPRTGFSYQKRDENKITWMRNDLEIFCAMLNDTLANLNNAGLLCGVVDNTLLHQLAQYKTKLAEDRLTAQAIEEAQTLPNIQRIALLSSLEAMRAQLRQIVEALAAKVKRNTLKGLRLEPYERCYYIFANNGRAEINFAQLEEDLTQSVSGDDVAAYIAEAEELFQKICAFDRKTRLFSGNAVRGVCENSPYKRGVIECYNGKIELDLTAVFGIDFSTDPEILKSTANPGTYITTK